MTASLLGGGCLAWSTQECNSRAWHARRPCASWAAPFAMPLGASGCSAGRAARDTEHVCFVQRDSRAARATPRTAATAAVPQARHIAGSLCLQPRQSARARHEPHARLASELALPACWLMRLACNVPVHLRSCQVPSRYQRLLSLTIHHFVCAGTAMWL